MFDAQQRVFKIYTEMKTKGYLDETGAPTFTDEDVTGCGRLDCTGAECNDGIATAMLVLSSVTAEQTAAMGKVME
jgi:hypothetical protein